MPITIECKPSEAGEGRVGELDFERIRPGIVGVDVVLELWKVYMEGCNRR
jgi:hypothetical protein